MSETAESKGGVRILDIILGVLVVALGIWCVMTPVETFGTIGWIAGFAMLFEGIGKVIAYFECKKEGTQDTFMLVGGILSALLGVVLLASMGMRWAYDLFIAYIVACWVIVAGVTNIVRSFGLRDARYNAGNLVVGGSWGWVLALGILLVILGIWGFFNPLMVMVALGWQIGFAVIAGGVNLILNSF